MEERDVDLAMLAAAASREDLVLDRLANLARIGTEVDVSMIVGGMLIHGRLGRFHEYAEHFDKALDEGYKQARAAADPDDPNVGPYVERMRKLLKDAPLAKGARMGEEATSELHDETKKLMGDKQDWRYADLPDELARKWINHDALPVAYTLKKARVVVGPMFTIDVEFLRVEARHISAWWLQADVVPDEG